MAKLRQLRTLATTTRKSLIGRERTWQLRAPDLEERTLRSVLDIVVSVNGCGWRPSCRDDVAPGPASGNLQGTNPRDRIRGFVVYVLRHVYFSFRVRVPPRIRIATGSVSGASTGAGQKVVAGKSAPALDSSPTIRTDRHDRFERANRRSRKKHQHP